jgi:DNA-binding transcriptional LysR family regulator
MDDSLRKFVAVVEAGTFTRAAELLHISQPALSVAVAKLEKTIGEKLLESNGRQGACSQA